MQPDISITAFQNGTC